MVEVAPQVVEVLDPDAQILRDDFGIDFNVPIAIDRLALGKKIDADIDIPFVPAD